MSYPVNITDLVSDIKVTCSFPNSAALMSDDEIIRRMSQAQETELVPLINSLRAEYFVTSSDTTVVSGQFSYDIPARAVGHKLRDISFVDSAGNEVDIPQLDPGQIKVKGGIVGYQSPLPVPYGYIFQNEKIKLFFGTPENNSILANFTSIRFKYYRKPNMLTATGNGSTVVTLPAANQITVTSAPTTWAAGTKIDIIGQNPIFPSRVDSLVIDTVVTNTVTFTTNLPSTVIAGDLVCPEHFTTTPQLPVECFDLLTQLVAVDIFAILGDTPGYQTATADLSSKRTAFLSEFSPRNEGTTIKINSNDTIMDSGWF